MKQDNNLSDVYSEQLIMKWPYTTYIYSSEFIGV